MFAGSTPTSTPRYSSVVNGRRPSTHFWAGTPGGWSTHAPVHRAATDSAGEGAADNGRFLGVSGATGGRTVGAGGAPAPRAGGGGGPGGGGAAPGAPGASAAGAPGRNGGAHPGADPHPARPR